MKRSRSLRLGALVLLLLASPAAATPWRWGLRAGVNGANFAGAYGDIVQPDLRYAVNAGFVAEAELSHVLSLHGEVAWSSKGGKGSPDNTDPSGNVVKSTDTWVYDYIEVPVLLRARLQRGKGTTLLAEAGPSFGFALAGRFTTDSPPGSPELDLKDQMKTVDAGFALGAGMEFPAARGRLGIDMRYTRGFTDLYESSSGFTSSINQVWTLAVSWMR